MAGFVEICANAGRMAPVKWDDVKRDGEPGPPASTARWGDRDFTDLLSLGFPVISPLYGMGHE